MCAALRAFPGGLREEQPWPQPQAAGCIGLHIVRLIREPNLIWKLVSSFLFGMLAPHSLTVKQKVGPENWLHARFAHGAHSPLMVHAGRSHWNHSLGAIFRCTRLFAVNFCNRLLTFLAKLSCSTKEGLIFVGLTSVKWTELTSSEN